MFPSNISTEKQITLRTHLLAKATG
ncbi:hypothetical protein LINPERPRIM_LOCUS26802 [Linum perenne]